MIVPRKIFDEIGGFNVSMRYYEDATFMFKIAAKHQVVVTSKVLTYYFTDVANNANSRMKKDSPLFPGYLPTLLELSKTNKDFWMYFFAKTELFLALASNLYFHKEERNTEIADKLLLSQDFWLFRRFVQYRYFRVSHLQATFLLKFRSLLLRFLRPLYD